MFAGAQPLGTGGTAQAPIVYKSGTPPNTDAGNPANFAAPTTPTATNPANPASPVGPAPLSNLLRYAGRFNFGGGNPLGGGGGIRRGLPFTSRFS